MTAAIGWAVYAIRFPFPAFEEILWTSEALDLNHRSMRISTTWTALLTLALLGGCASAPTPTPATAPAATAVLPPPPTMISAWTHGTMNLRAGAGTQYEIIRELPADTLIWIGAPRENGWAPVYDPQAEDFKVRGQEAWIYSKSTRLQPAPRGG